VRKLIEFILSLLPCDHATAPPPMHGRQTCFVCGRVRPYEGIGVRPGRWRRPTIVPMARAGISPRLFAPGRVVVLAPNERVLYNASGVPIGIEARI
jgi:hypothetical protein